MSHFRFQSVMCLALVAFAWAGVAPREIVADDRVSVMRLEAGTGQYVFRNSSGTAERPITVWYYCPEKLSAEPQVLVVMHGILRNGQEYRDAWVPLAREREFLLIVPEFSQEHYPGSACYNLGNRFTEDGKAVAEDQWAFSAIDAIFDDVCRRAEISAKTYTLYGHSAGAQFVHRLVMFKPEAKYDRAIAANAGWYTMPSFDVTYPSGLRYDDAQEQRANEERLRKALRRRVIVLLGEADTDENDPYLSRTPEAMAQGRHRLERGKKFFETAQREARRLQVPFAWELQTVPGVGHDNRLMAAPAVQALGW